MSSPSDHALSLLAKAYEQMFSEGLSIDDIRFVANHELTHIEVREGLRVMRETPSIGPRPEGGRDGAC